MARTLEDEQKTNNQYKNSERKLKELEQETYETEDYVEFPPDDIVAYNELRSCADIVRMFHNKQLIIDPEFQREFVWSESAQTRFIDSLTKQLPIPSMCISLDYKTDRRFVIDGRQRISTIIKFLTQAEWKLSKIPDVDPKISGKGVYEIKAKNPELYARVENLTIPITVIRYDASKPSHNNYLFTIFHRLNTGGTKLNNQEIRNCIYQGSFNDFLKNCVKYQNWQKLMDLEKKRTLRKERSTRFAYEELILRFFAFYDSYQNYKGTLAKFLNDYMDNHKNFKGEALENKEELFKTTVDLIYNKISEHKPLKISKVLTEGLLVGVAKNREKLIDISSSILKEKYQNLKSSDEYSTENLMGGILQKDKVQARIKKAIEIFSLADD